MLRFIIHQICLAKFFASLKETSENGTKKPSAKRGNRVPRVKVLNYLKKVALFFRFERDILADGDVYFFLFSSCLGLLFYFIPFHLNCGPDR